MPSPPTPVVPLNILYPNGSVEAVQIFIWDVDSAQPVLWDGSISIGSITIGDVDQGASGTDPWTFNLTKVGGTAFALGQQLAAASLPVVLTAAQITTLTPPAAITGFATAAKQDTGNTSLASIDTKTPALGQALAAASVPIVLTSAQLTTLTPLSSVTVSGSVTANASTNLNTSALALDATLTGVLTTSDFDTKTGSLTETAPATDTASSGLNGRLQRIAQRITSLITALGSPFQAGGSIGNSSFGVTGNVTVVQPTGTNLHAVVDSGTVTAVTSLTNALPTGSNVIGAVTQSGSWTVSGTVVPSVTKTIKSASGSFTSDTDIIAAVSSKRIKVIGYAFFTFGTSATSILLKSNGVSGTLLWTVALQAINKSNTGANMTMPAPSWLFATVAGEKLTADTNTTDTIYWSISYFDDDAT